MAKQNPMEAKIDNNEQGDQIVPVAENPTHAICSKALPKEIGGPSGLEPTRYGDWEKNGKVSDF